MCLIPHYLHLQKVQEKSAGKDLTSMGVDGRPSSAMSGLNVFADVVLHSLTLRTELNGVKGRCVDLKLEPLLGCCVVINGLASKPELNGCRGKTLSFDAEKGRYSVELDATSDSYMIKTCNLARDTESATTSREMIKKRWVVELKPNGGQVLIKPENLTHVCSNGECKKNLVPPILKCLRCKVRS